MSIIRPPQQWENNRAAKQVVQALQYCGEQLIILSMYHSLTDNAQPRCPNYNAIYKQDSHFKCDLCFGTTFAGGVKSMYRAWGVVTDKLNKEQYRILGEWQPSDRAVQLEPYPQLMQHDYIVRVQNWSPTYAPLVLGERYIVDAVQEQTLRTGNQYAQRYIEENEYQQRLTDKIGQVTRVHQVPQDWPIYSYIIPQSVIVPRIDSVPL